MSTCLLEHSTFKIDAAHQAVRRFDERFNAFFLNLVRQYVDVNPFERIMPVRVQALPRVHRQRGVDIHPR